MARGYKFFDNSRTDESRRTGNKHTHEPKSSMFVWTTKANIGRMIYPGKVVILYRYNG